MSAEQITLNENVLPAHLFSTITLGQCSVVKETKSGKTEGSSTIAHVFTGMTVQQILDYAEQEAIRKVASSLRNDPIFKAKVTNTNKTGKPFVVKHSEYVKTARMDISKLTSDELVSMMTPEQIRAIKEKLNKISNK